MEKPDKDVRPDTKAIRDKLSADIDAFLKKGGSVTHIDSNQDSAMQRAKDDRENQQAPNGKPAETWG